MKPKKRFVPLLLSVCLAFTLAAPVYAADISEEIIISPSNPAHPYAPSPGDADYPAWTSGDGSTHQFITNRAILLVKQTYTGAPLNSTSWTNEVTVKSDYPDQHNSGQTDGGFFTGHFYDPDTGLNWDGPGSATAKDRLVWWYNDAVSKYLAGDTSGSAHSLGCALHYAADLSTPHHAANLTALTNTNHAEFENYARAYKNNYIETAVQSSTYTWARSTSIGDMGHNFAVFAKSWADVAVDGTRFPEATEQTLPKAQRNCAAVIYKFLVDVGVVN